MTVKCPHCQKEIASSFFCSEMGKMATGEKKRRSKEQYVAMSVARWLKYRQSLENLEAQKNEPLKSENL